ncbi:MAG: DUF4825 domain-containing protein [Lachnospiraceae bacterium]|nr:DUF4825 domain-containing protein [Lachnospiraceae bacterium]
MSKLPCEVVKDLFPSYIDELTGEVTNNLIEEHTNECEECRQALESMRSPEGEPEKQSQKKEIDYLKKTRKKYRRNIFITIVLVLALVLGGLGVKQYFIGTTLQNEYLSCQIQVKDKEITAYCVAADNKKLISDIEFKEKDGVITIACKSVDNNPFFDSVSKETYVAENEIKEVRMGDCILWADGEYISTLASELFKTRHANVRDTKANLDTTTALRLSSVFPGYKCTVQKSEEPYGLHFQNGEQPGNIKSLEKDALEPCAYILLALIEDLGEVTYEFTHRGEPVTLTYTSEMATKNVGKDIKLVGENIAELEKLVRYAPTVANYFYWESITEGDAEIEYETPEFIDIDIVNNTGEELWAIGMTYYSDRGEELFSGESYFYPDVFDEFDIPFMMHVQDPYISLYKGESFDLKLTINDSDNVTYSTGERLTFPMDFDTKYELELSGNAAEGYHVTLK